MRMLDKDMKMLLLKSTLFILASKSLLMASPWFLKQVVDTMTIASGAIDMNKVFLGIGLFGASRIGSTLLQEFRMY